MKGINLPNCLTALRYCADILWIRIVPPDGKPDNLVSEPLYAAMPIKPKLQPLIMPVHGPEVIDPSCIESTMNKALSKLLACQIGFCELEILLYFLPKVFGVVINQNVRQKSVV